MNKDVGKTKDAGYQIGVRRTLSVSFEKTRSYLFSQQGLSLWLEGFPEKDFTAGGTFLSANNTGIKIRVFHPSSHVRIIPSKTGTTVSFHQEKLSGANQRSEMKTHWETIFAQLKKELE